MDSSLDWRKIYSGKVNQKHVLEAVKDTEWQKVRIYMKGKTLAEKYSTLSKWLSENSYSYTAHLQVTNYITALSRGGLIKPEDYREVTR